jgi:hypothetical protein
VPLIFFPEMLSVKDTCTGVKWSRNPGILPDNISFIASESLLFQFIAAAF